MTSENELSSNEDAILQGTFTGFRSRKKIKFVLNETGITAEIQSGKLIKKWDIRFDGVIGCHVKQIPISDKDVMMLIIYYYPLCVIKKMSTRKRYCHKIIVDLYPSLEKNRITAESWKKKILYYSKNIDLELEYIPPHYLVFLNPFSGQGNAKKIYKSLVQPMFEEADITHDLITTEYAGHAKEFCQNEDLSKWKGIIVVGGDGVLHEVLNGIMERKDWSKTIKIPLGIIAAGSGNGLAASLVFESTGFHFIDNIALMSVYEVCKGFTKKMDIGLVETLPASITQSESDNQNNPTQKRNISFFLLSFITGFVADVDIEGEKLRFLGGEARNYIYAVLRLITMRKYPLEISYLPADADHQKKSQNCNGNNDIDVNNDEFCYPINIENSGDISTLLKSPSLAEDLPQHWVTENSEYLQVLATLRSHIAVKKLLNSESKLEQGSMYLQLTKASVSRKHVLDLWDNVDNGIGPLHPEEEERAFNGNVKGIKCKAFRIKPTPKHSKILTIDGERIEFGPLQCEVHKGLARVFCSQ